MRAFTKATAAASRASYSDLVHDYDAAGMSGAVLAITSHSLDRAANGLADLLAMLKKGLRAGTSAGGDDGGGEGSGGGQGKRARALRRL